MTAEKNFENYETMMSVFGELDKNIVRISEALGVDIVAVGTGVRISGSEKAVDTALIALRSLEDLADSGFDMLPATVETAIDCAKAGKPLVGKDLTGTVAITVRGKAVKPRTLGQRLYVDAIKRNDIVFGAGPAGTGKTYLAVALAVSALKRGEVERIILTRPAVEAGEKLGFLPGDLNEKVDPYLRPIYDALREFSGDDNYQRLIERGTIEIAPLAYMRGRTLSHSFILLDEAQNTTREQMKMFLTRIGEGSKMVVTGDITQIDLPKNVRSGMVEAIEALDGVKGVEIVRFTSKDVIRHELVSRIIEAYEKYENRDSENI